MRPVGSAPTWSSLLILAAVAIALPQTGRAWQALTIKRCFSGQRNLPRRRSGLPRTPRSEDSSATLLWASNSNDSGGKDNRRSSGRKENEEDEEDFLRRMAVVRSLQMSYYKPSVSTDGSQDAAPRSSLEESTGRLLDLSLFRAPWVEVPGRSNVLNIHDPIYTNMFEKILFGPKPWCFGHLYLEGGSRNLKSDENRYQLETWKTTDTSSSSSSAVLGCLMKISDYRRFADGRLLLLVHAMERFVVTDVLEKLPYSVVHAQVLPDAEEIDPSLDFGFALGESDLSEARAMAIQESVRFHDYEYDRDHVLPVPDRPNLDVTDVLGSQIAKVLPYCPFSKTLPPPASSVLDSQTPEASSPAKSGEKNHSEQEESGADKKHSLEYRLLCQGVYRTPLTDPEFPERLDLTSDELEYELWIAINNFLIETRTPVSPVLLGLLPTHLDIWPSSRVAEESAAKYPMQTPNSMSRLEVNAKNTTITSESSRSTAVAPAQTATGHMDLPGNSKPFVLQQIVKDLASLDSMDHDFVQVSPDYPSYRRQRRLSYSAAHLLEKTSDVANQLRPKLLATPTTQQRLRMVLEQFDQWQEAKWGKFQ